MIHTEEQNSEIESPVPVGTVVDGYRVDRVIAVRAGLHTLVEATAPTGERVTLKLLTHPLEGKDLRRRAAKLARVHASISHPHVLSIVDDGKNRERLCLSGAPPKAVTLADRLRKGPLPVKEAVTLLSQLAGALETGRRRGLVHRALTPASIVVTTEDPTQALLTDFGIAVPDAPGCEHGESVEDADYRSPEEIRGETPTPESTVYSLGCILVTCLTGAPPYPYHRPVLAVHAHLVEAPPRVSERNPDLPPELDEVVAKAMAKDPSRRYGSPVLLMRAVQQAVGETAPIPGPSAPKQQQPSAPRKRESAVRAPQPAKERPAAPAPPERPPAPAPPERRAAPAPPAREPAGVPVPAQESAEAGHETRPHVPKPTRRRARGERRARTGGWARARRLAPTWAGIALLASALAGFAAGNGGSDKSKTPVAAAPGQVEHTSRSVADSSEPVVVPVVRELEKRRTAARRRLRAARLPAGQAAVAKQLAGIYGDARKSLLKAPGTSDKERRLAAQMHRVESAYRQLGRAPGRGSSAWRLASAEVLERERDLELLLRTHSWI